MKTMQKDLLINFFPICTSKVRVSCYRRMCASANDKKPDADHYRFTDTTGGVDTPAYWLTCDAHDGYDEYIFDADKHPMAARWVLSRRLFKALQEEIDAKVFYKARIVDAFYPRLEVLVKETKGVGWQGFIVEFDWQSVLRKHGLYVSFHFFKNERVPYSDEVQKLSLSLDSKGKPNRDLFRQYKEWLKAFYNRFLQGKTWLVGGDGSAICFGGMATLSARVLNGKMLEFANGEQNKSTYWGLKKSGPFMGCKDEPTFFFVFRKEYIQAARFLFECLCGREFPERFSGMTHFFGVKFDNSNIRHVILEGSDEEAHEQASRVIAAAGCKNPVAIVLVTGDEYEYLLQKSIYLGKGIPSQDVRVDHVRAGRNFQWSVAGVALQLFCKAGGVPWCVHTPRRQDLIIGVSQLWKKEEGRSRRFVAYSITTDASGFFRDIRTLSDEATEADYVSKLALRIKNQLDENIKNMHPKRIVLHCSFRLQRSAMDAIRKVIREVLQEQNHVVSIVVARVNTEHRYLAFDSVRETNIPDENTVMRLGRSAYLVWPDGTPPGGVAQTRPSSPVYIAFDRADPPINEDVERELLQDICNLSGVNWRGFNAKARPVSVFYCRLVGRMISDMDRYDLPIPAIEKMVPWFL